jgi:hypothetical protein
MSKRTFVIAGSDIGHTGGRYFSDNSGSPLSAARKASKVLFRMIENKANKPDWEKFDKFKDHKTVKFLLRESTKGSEKKTYYYEAKVNHLKSPKVYKRGDVEIEVTKEVVVKTCNDHISSA